MDSDDDEFDGYVDLQDYTGSSFDVNIQDETTNDEDISLNIVHFIWSCSQSVALQWIIVSAHAALKGLKKHLFM